MGAVPNPGEGSLHVRVRDPSGGRDHGRAGAQRGNAHREGRTQVSAKVVVIGGGHNGLVTAFYLAKSGHDVTVLERRSVVGGCAATEEFAPGFRAPLANALGPLRASVVRDMGLVGRVQFLRPDPRLVALAPDGH